MHLGRTTSRDFTGQGQAWGNQHPLLSSQSLARKASPQPDRLRHLLSQTRVSACRRSTRREYQSRYSRARQANPRSQSSPLGSLFTPLREEERHPQHPRCLPSTSLPQRGIDFPFHSRCQHAQGEYRRLFDHRVSSAMTKLRNPMTRLPEAVRPAG